MAGLLTGRLPVMADVMARTATRNQCDPGPVRPASVCGMRRPFSGDAGRACGAGPGIGHPDPAGLGANTWNQNVYSDDLADFSRAFTQDVAGGRGLLAGVLADLDIDLAAGPRLR
jgi:hypothetical protein